MKLCCLTLALVFSLARGTPTPTFPVPEVNVVVVDIAEEAVDLASFEQLRAQIETEEQLELDVAQRGSSAAVLDPAVAAALVALQPPLYASATEGTPELDPNLNTVTRDQPDVPVAVADLLSAAEIASILQNED